MPDRNIEAISKIQGYCIDINNTVSRFGNDINIFVNDKDFQNSICLSLLQIGELTNHLTQEFKDTFNTDVDWIGCKHFRNIVAHRYGSIKFSEVWNIVKNEVPDILKFCTSKINEYTVLNQYSDETEYDEQGENEENYDLYTTGRGR